MCDNFVVKTYTGNLFYFYSIRIPFVLRFEF